MMHHAQCGGSEPTPACAEKLQEISFLFLLILFLHSTYKLEIFKLSLGVHDLEYRTVNSKRGLLVMRDIGKADIER
jgi:hypothetical protein